jgi:hypothetical protein
MNPFYLGLIIGVSMGIGVFMGMVRMLFYVHNILGFPWDMTIEEYKERQEGYIRSLEYEVGIISNLEEECYLLSQLERKD